VQYVVGERRVYVFLYGHSLNLILKYCLAMKIEMIALVIYVPHKKFTVITMTGRPLLRKPDECGKTHKVEKSAQNHPFPMLSCIT
jgi:hypothetical protein